MTVRLLWAVLLAGALVVVAPQAALACSCAQRSVTQQIEAADTVLAGTVEWTSTDQVTTRVYSVRVDTVYRGAAGAIERVETPVSSASCGLEDLAAGERVLLFAQGRHPGRLSAGLCDGSGAFDQAVADQVVAITGTTAEPPPAAPVDPLLPDGPRADAWSWSGPLSTAGGVVVLAVVALVAVRLVRRRRQSS